MEKENNKSWIATALSIFFISGFFAVCCLLLANLGVNAYKNVVLTNDANFELRTSLSYVATKIRQCDLIDYPKVIQVDGIDCLVLGEEINQNRFETILFYKDGYLNEIFQEAGREFQLGYASQTLEVSAFTFTQQANNQILLRARNNSQDSEELTIALRSGR